MNETNESELLARMEVLRGDLAIARRRELLWRVFVIAVVLGFVLAFTSLHQTTNEIVAARASARVGLCSAIDDMRMKHNHFVNTGIDERQALIAETDASTATPEQKAANRKFFEDKIANYRQDLVDIVDCNNPDSLSTLFTKPKPGG